MLYLFILRSKVILYWSMLVSILCPWVLIALIIVIYIYMQEVFDLIVFCYFLLNPSTELDQIYKLTSIQIDLFFFIIYIFALV